MGPTVGLEVLEKGKIISCFLRKNQFPPPTRKEVPVSTVRSGHQADTREARYEAIRSDNTQQTLTATSVNNHVHGPKRYLPVPRLTADRRSLL